MNLVKERQCLSTAEAAWEHTGDERVNVTVTWEPGARQGYIMVSRLCKFNEHRKDFKTEPPALPRPKQETADPSHNHRRPLSTGAQHKTGRGRTAHCDHILWLADLSHVSVGHTPGNYGNSIRQVDS